MPGIGEYVGIENRHIFPCGSADRLRQKAGMALPVDPRPYRPAQRVVRRMQEVGIGNSCFSPRAAGATRHLSSREALPHAKAPKKSLNQEYIFS
jgi:hypothetical protein